MNQSDAQSQTEAVGDLERAFASLRASSEGVVSGLAFDLKASTAEIRRMERETSSLSRSIGFGLRRAMDDAIFRGGRLSDVFRGLALSMSRSVLKSALTPVQNALGGAVSNLFGGFAGPVKAFAKGGVVAGATTFPMRGATGLMGEAGPEAILPLSRGPDGSLGVRSGGGGGASIVVNIATPDPDSFRRSQSQIAASIARAVRRGERNM